ncbi:MAG: hypothetical protein Q4C87_06395 [Actinomycetaceae bacterium]|nr:hypothetical protein [Actinomycetaceae bacterium]
MVNSYRTPRRPAMLSAQAADAIIGDDDPAEGSVIAHTSAWALFGVGDEEFGADAVIRLRETIRNEGVDVVAHMWSRSPEFTLPGALWRLWLLSEWYRQHSHIVMRRFEEGMAAPRVPGLEPPIQCDPPTVVIERIFALLAGECTEDDLPEILAGAARLMRVLAAGESMGATWIADPNDPLAFPVTLRGRALLRTAEELDRAAMEAEVGALE